MALPLVPNMWLYISEGLCICVTNTLLLFSIFGSSRNRNRREFLLVAAGGIADYIYAVAFMLMARWRLHLAAEDKVATNTTVWDCATQLALPLHDLATPMLGLYPLSVSVNFLISSLFPLWYIRARHSYTITLLSVPTAICVLLVILNYIMIWGSEVEMSVMCVAANGAANFYVYHFMIILRMIANLSSGIIYAAILVFLWRKGYKQMQQVSAQQRKLHRRAMTTLGLVTVNSMVLLFVPDVLLFFNPNNVTAKYSTLLYSMTLSKTVANFFIYMLCYRELRALLFNSVFGKMPCFERMVSTIGVSHVDRNPTKSNNNSIAPLSDRRRSTVAQVEPTSNLRPPTSQQRRVSNDAERMDDALARWREKRHSQVKFDNQRTAN